MNFDPPFLHEEVVEIYGTDVPTPPTPATVRRDGLNIYTPYLTVNQKHFFRTVSREAGQPDILWEQTVEAIREMRIQHAPLPLDAMNSGELLRESIIIQPPVAPYHVNDDVWLRVADTLSLFAVESPAFELGEVFGVTGDIAYGDVRVISPDAGWVRGVWDLSVPVPHLDRDSRCSICFKKNKFNTQAHIDGLIAFPCGHLFHRVCGFSQVWRNSVHNGLAHASCPNCRRNLS